MKPDKNNNRAVIWRVAKSNLTGNKLYSLLSSFTIFLAVSFVTIIALYGKSQSQAEADTLARMQQVTFIKVANEQLDSLKEDERVADFVRYKTGVRDVTIQGINCTPIYAGHDGQQIVTYELSEGRPPQEINEIVVDRRLLAALDLSGQIGQTVEIGYPNGEKDAFTVTGLTDNAYQAEPYDIYVSELFARTNQVMASVDFMVLLRIQDAENMNFNTFKSLVYEMAEEYQVSRPDISISSKFEFSMVAADQTGLVVGLIAIVVAAAGMIVIYSVFYLSVSGRIRQIGQLHTIGMTEKQIKKMVKAEGIIMSSLSIPLALIFGGVLSYLISPEGWRLLTFAITSVIIGTASFFIVRISVGKPAAMASRISPIEAAKATGGSTDERPQKEHRLLTPFTLATATRGGEKKKRRLSTLSLAVGGCLFILASIFISSWDEDQYSRQGEFVDAEYLITYSYSAEGGSEAYGTTNLQIRGILNNDLIEKIRVMPEVKQVKAKKIVMANLEIDEKTMLVEIVPIDPDDLLYTDNIEHGTADYEQLTEKNGMLVTNTDVVEEVFGIDIKVGDIIILNWYNGEERSIEIPVLGTISSGVDNEEGDVFHMSQETVSELWTGVNQISDIRITAANYEKDRDALEIQLQQLIADEPDLQMLTLKARQQANIITIRKISLQIYGISIFIILFSILNLINLMISNIITRRQELAMLESIGMEEKQIRKMLFYESIQMALPNILISLTVGTALGYTLITIMKQVASYMEFVFPYLAALIYIFMMFLIPVLISALCLRILRKTSLVERIKPSN